jgi:adenosylmethionine---8-amino-7-oxononanoate aminotransferase
MLAQKVLHVTSTLSSDMSQSANDMLQFDRDHLWHPYASMKTSAPVLPVVSARGVRLQLADGRELIDGTSSWWSAVHGYNHPILNHAAHAQIDTMSNVMFGGITHPPAVKLGELLTALTPAPLTQIFFCDSGSVAVEIAIKMALQYWQSLGQVKKDKLLTARGGYHGDTFMAMSVCDPINGMHRLFSGVLPQQLFVDQPRARFGEPFDDSELDSLKKTLIDRHEEIAALIIEPIFQGASSMHFYAHEYLQHVRRLCDDYGVLLICDEIATGFGRTGKLFACEHAGISADILCLGKAITGGYLSFAATLCTRQISDAICSAPPGALMHGPTFMANPLACAIACASIELLISQPWQRVVRHIESQLRIGLAPASTLPNVANVRVLGAIGVIEMREFVNVPVTQQLFVESGLWVRPFGKFIYAMPPFIIGDNDLTAVTRGMVEVAAKLQD